MTVAFLICGAVALPAAPQQRFEVSSVTACPPTTVTQTDAQFRLSAVRPGGLQIGRTRVVVHCQTVEAVIYMAYNGGHYGHVNAAGRDVVGGPTLTALANVFDLDRHVSDQTGVKDRFAIHLEYETEPPGAAPLIKALEGQLGLTLVSTKGKRSWVQIEGIERPSLR